MRRRCRLAPLELERRLVPANIVVPLDPGLDQFGDQIATVQAYGDASRTTFSIFDTGASAVTFSPDDQDGFAFLGNPIPIKVPGGAIAGGIGGTVVGDVSQPGKIITNGMHAVTFSFDDFLNPFSFDLTGDALQTDSNIQVFVGTADGSPELPTITGTPVLNPVPVTHSGGMAAKVDMQGFAFDLTSLIDGLVLPMPDLHFVDAGTTLPQPVDTTTTAPVYLPLDFLGEDNHTDPGDLITVSPSPMDNHVTLINNATVPAPTTAADKHFLLDTGAQLSVVSTDLAQEIGFDLAHPEFNITVGGVGGQVDIPGFLLSELDLPTTDPGTLVQFTNVPIFVLDVDPAIDGILGMNLWNTAQTLLYDPFNSGGSRLGVTFFTDPNRGLDQVDPSTLAVLQGIGLASFVGTFSDHDVPGFKPQVTQATAQFAYDDAAVATYTTSGDGISNLSIQHIGNQYTFTDTGVTSITAAGSRALSVSGSGTQSVTISALDLQSIVIDTGAGGDVINLMSTGVPTRITTSGSASVNLGSAGSVQEITAPVTIASSSGATALTIDDSAATDSRTIDVTGASVTGLAPATIAYDAGALAALTVKAGSGGDTITVTPGPTPIPHVQVDPGAGSNNLALNGSSGADTAALAPGAATLAGPGYEIDVPHDATSVVVTGRGGADSASFSDSPGDDYFYARGATGVMTGSGFSARVRGFHTISGAAAAGGSDRAQLYDTPGDDVFTAQGATASMTGPGYATSISGFGRITGYSVSGGNDAALLHDTPGNDTFTAQGTSAVMVGSGYVDTARGFASITADAQAGSNVARLEDTTGNDVFSAHGASASITGAGYADSVTGFGRIAAYARRGGNDSAQFHDTAGNDAFTAQGTYGSMRGSAFRTTATGFATIDISGHTGGTDYVALYDTAGNDTFTGLGSTATLAGTGYQVKATGIATVYATSQAGGTDHLSASNLNFTLRQSGPWQTGGPVPRRSSNTTLAAIADAQLTTARRRSWQQTVDALFASASL